MKKIFIITILLSSFFSNTFSYNLSRPIEFTIIIPTYNNEKYCIGNLESALLQNYPTHLVDILIVEDNSKDSTYSLLSSYIQKNSLQNRVKLVHNVQRQGALKNWYMAVNSCPDHKVIINLDGDDKLAHQWVLAHIAKIYSDGNTWLTYGQFLRIPSNSLGWCRPFPKHVLENNLFRIHEWISSHLRTFYAELFKNIKAEDLMVNNQFYSVAPDLAFMFPQLEMASKGHITFIPEVLYLYNEGNPLNEYKIDPAYVVQVGQHIRSRKPYTPLRKLNCLSYYK